MSAAAIVLDIALKIPYMSNMYEMIMDLPLFKGVSKDQVSSFLEKTHINFRNINSGELVVAAGDNVRMITFIISGEVTINHRLDSFDITVEERGGAGTVIGADHLYGMSTHYPCDVVALAKVSVLEFSKEQYLRLLNSDNIYLLNFFNFLSLRAQRPVTALTGLRSMDIRCRISLLLSLLTDSDATTVKIKGSPAEIARLFSICADDLSHWLDNAREEGIVSIDENGFTILSRNNFVG